MVLWRRRKLLEPDLLFSARMCWKKWRGELDKTVAQVAINWLLGNDSVANVVMGARNEQQLVENLGAVGWRLPEELMRRLNEVSAQHPLYPHWVTAR